jgi:hypothetical protein
MRLLPGERREAGFQVDIGFSMLNAPQLESKYKQSWRMLSSPNIRRYMAVHQFSVEVVNGVELGIQNEKPFKPFSLSNPSRPDLDSGIKYISVIEAVL